MYKLFTTSMISVIAQASFTYRYSGNNWMSWSARHKWERMVDELLEDTEGTDAQNYSSLTDLFKQQSNRTTCSTSDELPRNNGVDG